MNWVGGSRTRVLIKQERRKQKEYFERNRLKSKMKLLGVLSPVKNSTVSLDLLNLYMVNQISCKKKIPETIKKPIHVNMNRDIKMPLRHRELEFPMSPHCVPSKLCLDDTENNIHYQKLDRKEELGEVQSSQIMDSSTVFEPQFSKIENCSFIQPSFSAELSSNRCIPGQNFIPRMVSGSQKVVYEQKQNEQLSNVNSSESLISKINESQDDVSSSYKKAHSGTLFEGLNSPGNGNFLTKRAALIMGEDRGSKDGRGQSDFIIENQSVQHIWGENGNEVSNFLDMKQTTNSFLSENCDSFVHQNMINLLSIDQQRIKNTFDKCGSDRLGDTCLVTGSEENHSTDGSIRNIFAVPESTFSNSAFNKTSYPEQYQLKKNYQKEHNSEVNDLSTSFEKNCYPTSFEEKGTLENDYQEKTPQENIQEYPVNSMGNIPFGELYPKPSLDFGLGEIPMEEGGTCFLKSRPTSTQKIFLDSSQSSQSASYSPRPTDSCFSSSSEMPSEDEDQILQQTEDSNKKRNLKTTEAVDNFYIEKFQCNSAHVLQSQASDDCMLQVARCDAGVQTDREPVVEGKSDAAVQCDLIPKCTCRSGVSSPCSIERCSENVKADTTGGQEILKNN